MHIYFFEYNGQRFGLNISNQTVKNEATGQVRAIGDLRDLSFIGAVKLCFESIQRVRETGQDD